MLHQVRFNWKYDLNARGRCSSRVNEANLFEFLTIDNHLLFLLLIKQMKTLTEEANIAFARKNTMISGKS